MLKSFFRITLFCSVVGGILWGLTKIYSVKTPGADLVGIHTRESKIADTNGSKPISYTQIKRKTPPYQFHGGTEGGNIPFTAAADTSRPIFLPRGVYKVSGYVYGDCRQHMSRHFYASAVSLASRGDEYPYFLNKSNILPDSRSSVGFDAILKIEQSSKYVIQVDSESPLWGMRIERITNKNDGEGWSGEKASVKKPTPKHCWSDDDYAREDDRKALERDRNFAREQRTIYR